MLIHRLTRVLGAAALAASLATAGPAGAVERRIEGPRESGWQPVPSYRVVESAEASDPLGLAPQRRSIYSAVNRHGRRTYLLGDVESWSGRLVRIQRSACEHCKWRRHDTVRTGRGGWFRSRIGTPRRGSTYWRAVVRASGGYAKSYSSVWATYYR